MNFLTRVEAIFVLWMFYLIGLYMKEIEMNKIELATFLFKGKRAFTANEIKGFDILLSTLNGIYPSFDIYTAVLGGGVRTICFGINGKQHDNKGKNSPAFAIYGTKCEFGTRSEDKLLLAEIKALRKSKEFAIKFNLSELTDNKAELNRYLQALSSLGEIQKRMCGQGIGNDFSVSDSINKSSDDSWSEDVLSSIKVRRGQPKFRKLLLEAFAGQCAVTGCAIEDVLEAAHIIPHTEKVNYSVSNGLLLRADVHTLFDLNLIKINQNGDIYWDKSINHDPSYDYIKKNQVITFPAGNKEKIDLFKSSLDQRFKS